METSSLKAISETFHDFANTKLDEKNLDYLLSLDDRQKTVLSSFHFSEITIVSRGHIEGFANLGTNKNLLLIINMSERKIFLGGGLQELFPFESRANEIFFELLDESGIMKSIKIYYWNEREGSRLNDEKE